MLQQRFRLIPIISDWVLFPLSMIFPCVISIWLQLISDEFGNNNAVVKMKVDHYKTKGRLKIFRDLYDKSRQRVQIILG